MAIRHVARGLASALAIVILANAGVAPASARPINNANGDRVSAPQAITPTTTTWDWFSWGNPIQFRVATQPVTTGNGVIELLVDGSTHASFRYSPSQTGSPPPPSPTFSAVNNLSPGPHSVQVKWTPKIDAYAPSMSTTMSVDDTATPTAGITINGGGPATNTLGVRVQPAQVDDGTSIDEVRLSNASTMAGELLADGTTYARAANINWTLAGGADGVRTVWAQFHRNDGTWSAVTSDTIYFDTTRPTGSFQINDGAAGIGDPWTNSITDQTLDGSVADASIAFGGEITHIAWGGSHGRYKVEPFTLDPNDFSYTNFNLLDSVFAYPAEPGLKTIWVKWRDSAGNWSLPVSDDILHADLSTVGRVLIDGEHTAPPYPSYRSSPTVLVTIEMDYMPPNGIDKIRVGNELEDSPTKVIEWDGGAEQMTFTWSLTNSTWGYGSSDGIKNVAVAVITNDGLRAEIGASVVLDRVTPTSNKPVTAFALGSIVEESGSVSGTTLAAADGTLVESQVSWAGKDNVLLAEFDVQRALNGSTWSDVSLANPTATSVDQSLAVGTSNQFRVRGVDEAGNLGAWKNGPALGVSVKQQNDPSVVVKGTWRLETRTDALGDSVSSASVQGNSAKLTFTGRGIAIVAPRRPNSDSIKVYVDGKLIKTVSLGAASYEARYVAFSMAWSTRGTHTVRIVKKSANSLPVALDAFLVLT
ncbi:MAG TPA: hypothetical protein VEX37_00415 [Thermomicrobiales bacterium]|nr:hypothetical protein [Thermomicrobiales bacterium]